MNYSIIIAIMLMLDLNNASSNKIIFKLKRTDNYKLIYNNQTQTTYYTKMKLSH